MKLAPVTLSLYGMVLLAGGFLTYSSSGRVVSLLAGILIFLFLLFLAIRSLRGSLRAGYTGGVVTFLLAIYFAYRFLATESFVPSGVLLLISFMALFGVTLGVFLGLRERL
jgi:uncharacterized membrane protein (UPF0136 family)